MAKAIKGQVSTREGNVVTTKNGKPVMIKEVKDREQKRGGPIGG